MIPAPGLEDFGIEADEDEWQEMLFEMPDEPAAGSGAAA